MAKRTRTVIFSFFEGRFFVEGLGHPCQAAEGGVLAALAEAGEAGEKHRERDGEDEEDDREFQQAEASPGAGHSSSQFTMSANFPSPPGSPSEP